MIQEAIAKLVKREDLTQEEAEACMEEIMTGQATDSQIAGFLIALRMKGETVDEITACAKVMREKATKINVRGDIDIDREDINLDMETIVDTCGTGGSGTNTFNISTATSFVVAGAGVKVAKHGNRSASSACGSADVLQQLGVNLDVSPGLVAECINEIGIGFLFAPLLHTAMKFAIGPRKELGVRTIFNILGPLTNPAEANTQVLGVYDPDLTEKMAQVLRNLGARKVFVVHGEDSLDEITITGKTKVTELSNDEIKTYYIEPSDFGFQNATLDDIRGGDTKENAEIVTSVLKGEKGPRRDVVLLNAAYALLAAGEVNNPMDGIHLSEETIDSGKAYEKLELLRKYTNK